MNRHALALGVVLLGCAACARTMSVSEEFSYDPPGSTVTTDKPISPPGQSDAWLDGQSVGVSTRFPGGGLAGVQWQGDSLLQLEIRPENAPVNNSAWFAFRVWAPQEREVVIDLRYAEGTHRYIPKISVDGRDWTPLADGRFLPDTVDGTARLRLRVGPDSLWVAAQELKTSREIYAWMDDLAALPFVEVAEFGQSRLGRPLRRLQIGAPEPANRYVLVMGRQHPPEVTGSLALEAFVETIADSSALAQRFRRAFTTLAVPLVNPDGVDGGHWRHNAGGVDLNRDWAAFNQPETRQVRDLFLSTVEDQSARVYFAIDFHSTQEDVFYTLTPDLPTEPADFTPRWLAAIGAALPEYRVYEEAFGLGSPISKNWFYETFRCPAVTYEAGDEVDRALLRGVADRSARAMMRLLLEAIGEDPGETG